MKIIISKYAGFCFGVTRAVEMVEKLPNSCPCPIFMLGNLVHNEEVVNKLKEKGIKIVDSLEKINSGTVIISAHGVAPQIIQKAKKKKLNIIDTTCPFVLKPHQLVKFLEKQGYQVVIFGDKEHIEVKGIAGEAKSKTIIIESLAAAKKFPWGNFKKIGIVSQTTKSVEDFDKFVKYIKSQNKEVKVFDTICDSTRGRQADIKRLARENTAILVIGSKTSANTQRLYEAARKINPKTYFVCDKNNFKKEWFKNAKSVGISAGASTPIWIIKEVAEAIKQDNKITR